MKLVIGFLILLLTLVCSGQSYRPAEKDAPSKIVIPSKDEPGDTLIVSGTVYGPDGVTPLKDVSVYVYHTDIKGYYSAETTNNSNPRLRGWMRTSADGKYEFRTIKPGPYPSGRVPAHIHYVVTAPGYKEKIFEIVFEDDPFISDQMREDSKREDSIFSIKQAQRDSQGVLRCVQDIKLKRE